MMLNDYKSNDGVLKLNWDWVVKINWNGKSCSKCSLVIEYIEDESSMVI